MARRATLWAAWAPLALCGCGAGPGGAGAPASGPAGAAGTGTGTGGGSQPIPPADGVPCVPLTSPSFNKSRVENAVFKDPTSLAFGPDGRLYVAEQGGRIWALTIARVGTNRYAAVQSESIDMVRAIPNHDDDGADAPAVQGRLVTGIATGGTPQAPVVYVASSDPRFSGPIDTNSGVLSALRFDGQSWSLQNLVRGLPRSNEAHACNGLFLDEPAGRLYVAQGGHTNMGAPSTTLGQLPEYALSAAILVVDLAQIGAQTYDLPTLDDEDRRGNPDAGDPFGGNRGKNQARLERSGPVQVHSPGWRNPYDLVIASSGLMYAFDNGPNAGWGGPPIACSNALGDATWPTFGDQLHCVPQAGFYAGHPNPARGSQTVVFNPSHPQSPVVFDDPRQCDWLEPGLAVAAGGDGALCVLPFSTDGITEYRASNFSGAMTGNLLATGFDDSVQRIELAPSGLSVQQVQPLFSNVGSMPLDVVARGDDETFPGTVWVAVHDSGRVYVYEPLDYGRGCAAPCDGADAWGVDDDGDGFANADEILSGTNPCSAASFPSDADGDALSDASDPDDDNDGLADTLDPFAVDAANGLNTHPPLVFSWVAGNPGTGILGLGFTGLMTNGATDYSKLFDPDKMTAGGAAGVLTFDNTRTGTPLGSKNTLYSGLQLGIDAGAHSGPYRVQTRVLGPFFNGQVPTAGQAQGLFIGTGSQDDYVRLVLAAGAAQGALEVGLEVGGTYQMSVVPAAVLASPWVDLRLWVDTVNQRVQPRCALSDGVFFDVGPALSIPVGSLLHGPLFGSTPLAVGLQACDSTHTGFTATWDEFRVELGGP